MPTINPQKKPETAREKKTLVMSLARLREEAEDILDTIDLLEARARNLGKPRKTLDEVKKKFGLA